MGFATMKKEIRRVLFCRLYDRKQKIKEDRVSKFKSKNKAELKEITKLIKEANKIKNKISNKDVTVHINLTRPEDYAIYASEPFNISDLSNELLVELATSGFEEVKLGEIYNKIEKIQ